MLLICITSENPPIRSSYAILSGARYCYDYYYSSESEVYSSISLSMSASPTCYTTVFLSVYYLSFVYLSLTTQGNTSGLIGQVASAILNSINLHILSYSDAFQFNLVVTGQLLTISNTTIKMSKGCDLSVSSIAGLTACFITNTTFMDFGYLNNLFRNSIGFVENLTLVFQYQNEDQTNALLLYSIHCNKDNLLISCSSCYLGQTFDPIAKQCVKLFNDDMECSECSVGFIKGRGGQNRSCFEQTQTLEGGEDCYYYQVGEKIDVSCK